MNEREAQSSILGCLAWRIEQKRAYTRKYNLRAKQKQGKLTKEEQQIFRFLEIAYGLVHFADFIMDSKSQQVMYWLTSGNPMFVTAASEYLEKRHAAIDHLMATAKPKKREEAGDEAPANRA